MEDRRQRGERLDAPKYNDTPLLTVGKEVRVGKGGVCRRALIECVNEDSGTVDISYEDGDEEEETVPFHAVRPLEEYEHPPTCAAGGAAQKAAEDRVLARASVEQRRQLGLRPHMPAYNDTPLISIGKQVRVQKGAKCRRAMIECIDEGDGTADVAFLPRVEVWPMVSEGGRDQQEPEDETVPIHAIMPLEEFEVRKESDWQQAFLGDFYGAVAALKEGGNALFKLKDYDAAATYYSIAIDRLRELEPSDLSVVLLVQGGSLVSGKVKSTDSRSQRATVAILQPGCGHMLDVSVLVRSLIPVHGGQLVLQGSLYMNRARSLTQLERHREAAQDLSVIIGLWESSGNSAERREQLTKAYCLRAKARLSRMKIAPARLDVKAAWPLQPPEATVKLLRQIERDIDVAEKEKLRSNKRLAKEIAKLADAAMSNMDQAQLEALGNVPPD